MRELRCGKCDKLLAKGSAVELVIKCPRCKTINHVRAKSPDHEGPEPRNGVQHDHTYCF
ncbi:Com family DNA-binding transcriptional regulator [Desulfocurvibacter africanus]|uniref:Com family DNA-binding transcriptional regulator n=1 Tax=Desulfocurvibacter africanus TaxID=873 RepID=UPI0009DA37AC|nr:Com family DNA-binding transcriptional regulator [Desulfocurvibacter africanus]